MKAVLSELQVSMKERPMHEIQTVEPAGYAEFLAELKQRIERAQLRASLAMNWELVLLYWQIGREILSRQDRESCARRSSIASPPS